jgi:capsule polysaccharide export protein KpsE/RkpR
MGGAALLATLVGHSGSSLGSLGALAGGFLGGGGNTALFIDLLRSGTVTGHLVDRFQLQRLYHKRCRVDAAKKLAHRTAIVDDKKSGVITLTVTDTDPMRARDIAESYLDELNLLVNRTNTSSAHQERMFIEARLRGVQADLSKAQENLSDFSSTHATIDIKEQTWALVDAASRLQSQLIVEHSGLDSLRKIYGDDNVRGRSTEARAAYLQREIAKIGGSSKALPAGDTAKATGVDNASSQDDEAYPPLRQLPRLAVPFADLYRKVRVQETVYEVLTQQYEIARIQEAKDVPVVSVIDVPGVPEKKPFPPRLILAVAGSMLSVVMVSGLLLIRRRWSLVPMQDPAKLLLQRIQETLPFSVAALRSWSQKTRSTP